MFCIPLKRQKFERGIESEFIWSSLIPRLEIDKIMIDFYHSVTIWIVLISDTLKKNHVDKLSKIKRYNDINFVDICRTW